ncbi:MAG: hypothetical protein WC979_06080 [Candidatus Pacearchaeota archaeon]|jgi:hypothetical protein
MKSKKLLKSSKPLIKLNLPMEFSEKITPKKQIAIRTEEEITAYKRLFGYRKARVKRYGNVPAKKAR